MAVKSKYQPFSFQERMAPLMMLQEQYDKTNENLLALGEQATQFYQYLDKDTKAVVDQYNAELSKVAGSLASDGMKAVSRNTLTRLRSMYNNEVKPINTAAQTLSKMYEEQRSLEGRMSASGQKLFSSRMPTVRELLENPGASPQNIGSGALYNQGLQAAKSSSLRRFSETAFGSEIIRGYINQVKEQGYSPELVARFMNDIDSIPELKNAYNEIRDMYNTQGLSDANGADQFIMRGILDGMMYSRETSQKEDIIGKENRAFARQKALAQFNADLEVDTARRRAAATGKGTFTDRKKVIVSPRAVNTTSQKFYDSKTNSIKLPDYLFDNEGKLKDPSVAKGVGHMYGSVYVPSAPPRGNGEYDTLRSILGEYYTDEQIDNMTKDDITNILDGIVHNSLRDAEGNSGFYWNLDASDTKDMLSRIGELYEVKGKENGKWTFSSDTKDVSSEQKNKGSQLIYDPVSNELFLSFDNSKKMYRIDKGAISDQDILDGLDYYHTPYEELGGMNRMDYSRRSMAENEEILETLASKAANNQKLTPEEQRMYMEAYEAYTGAASVQEGANELYSSIGPTILSYLKKRDE